MRIAPRLPHPQPVTGLAERAAHPPERATARMLHPGAELAVDGCERESRTSVNSVDGEPLALLTWRRLDPPPRLRLLPGQESAHHRATEEDGTFLGGHRRPLLIRQPM